MVVDYQPSDPGGFLFFVVLQTEPASSIWDKFESTALKITGVSFFPVGSDLMDRVDDRHKRASMIITSLLPVNCWHREIR